MAIGPPEIAVILIIFFLLFGAERLPKLARSMGQAKGEFQEGLNEVVHIPEKKKTFTDILSQAISEKFFYIGKGVASSILTKEKVSIIT